MVPTVVHYCLPIGQQLSHVGLFQFNSVSLLWMHLYTYMVFHKKAPFLFLL